MDACNGMKMYYFRGVPPNFGDELNVWLWPRLLPGLFNEHAQCMFLGIGSILFDYHPANARKVVFGAGYGGYTRPPTLDASWDVFFVRGPVTARALGIDESLGIGDGAILLRSCITAQPPKRFKTSFMPHWESLATGKWREACADAGIHLIDPAEPVERVIEDILSSDMIVTEAMHGAIVADALRVPWVPARPIQPQHRGKWVDWSSALEIRLHPRALASSTALEAALTVFTRSKRGAERVQRRARFLKDVAAGHFRERAAASLQALAATTPTLSRDTMIERAHSRMLEQVDALTRRYGRGVS